MSDRPPHRHMWFWAVLPPETRHVAIAGDPELAETLRASGFDVPHGPPGGADAVLGDGVPPRAVPALAAALPEHGVLALAVGGGRAAVPEHQPRAARALELLLGPLHAAAAAARARRLSEALRREGLHVETLATGERSRVYGIGPGVWRRTRRLPLGRLVVGAPGRLPAALPETALAQASAQLGAPLRRVGMTMTEDGKLMVEAQDPAGRSYILRLAGGPARPLLERSFACLSELAVAAPGPALRRRVTWPLADGEAGAARWVIEAKAAGRAPRRLTPALWDECVDLLVELHACGAGTGGAGGQDGHTVLAAQTAAVGAYLDPARTAVLARVAERLRERLAGVPLGWAHGDFWSENLLVRHGRLNVIVDWDWAARRSLPMLDLMDLIASSTRRSRELRPGPRCVELLWPLARSGGDVRMRGYCLRTGTPSDRRTLEALAVAYWLAHVARDLRPFVGRRRPRWLAENVAGPLDTLVGAGW